MDPRSRLAASHVCSEFPIVDRIGKCAAQDIEYSPLGCPAVVLSPASTVPDVPADAMHVHESVTMRVREPVRQPCLTTMQSREVSSFPIDLVGTSRGGLGRVSVTLGLPGSP